MSLDIDLVEMDKTKGFGHYIDRTVKTIQMAYQKVFNTQAVDLTIEQWVFLQQIYEGGEYVSQRELTNLNFRTRATTSRMITKLVGKGYINKTRFEGDRKQFKLSLSSHGKETIEKLLPYIQHLRAIGYQEINEADFVTFLNVLDQIWKNYQQTDLQPPKNKKPTQ